MLLNRKLLAKILSMMADETSDGEVLNAARMATNMVKEAGTTWEQVLNAQPQRAVTVTVTRHEAPQQAEQPEGWLAAHLKDKVTIDMMFRAVFAQPRSSNEEFWQFMDSLHHWFNTHGSLSQKQYQALRSAYTRVVRAS